MTGMVRLGDNEIAEILINGSWTPICGHWFWDNHDGAKMFCQQLGFSNGAIGDRITLPSDGFRIGKCKLGDVWPDCSSGCNDHSIGGTSCTAVHDDWYCHQCSCQSGAMAGITIHCSDNQSPLIEDSGGNASIK